MVGPIWSAGRGAVRIYWPNLDFEHDTPTSHPIAVPNHPGPWLGIEKLDWQYTNGSNEEEFRLFLLNGMLRHEATRMRDWSGFLFCREVQARRYQLKREQDAAKESKLAEEWAKIESKDELCEQLTKEVDRLKEQIKTQKKEHAEEINGFERWLQENRQQTDEYRLLIRALEKQLEDQKTANHDLRSLNDSLRLSLQAKTSDEPKEIPIPETFDSMDGWVKTYFADRLVLIPRAAHNIRKAVYEDVGLVYKALLLLAGPFRDMKMNPAKESAWESERIRLGLHFGPSISESEFGKYKEDYTVYYPVHSNNKRFAEYHLRKGVTREDRYCLAIYFFWDEKDKLVVVTWLPSHLDNRLT